MFASLGYANVIFSGVGTSWLLVVGSLAILSLVLRLFVKRIFGHKLDSFTKSLANKGKSGKSSKKSGGGNRASK